MMFSDSKKGLSARQVKAGRALIEADRCAKRPGLRHDWQPDDNFDTFQGADIVFYTCTKCGQTGSASH